jgi:hypothetical protein
MRLILVVACCGLLLSGGAMARAVAQGDRAAIAARADSRAAEITDTRAYLAEIDDAIRMARAGQYGTIGRSGHRRLDAAQRRIHSLLAGHDSALELAPDERVGLYNAQEMVRSLLRSDDKDRMVCRRETKTGSRIPKTECLTVAEREERAQTARQSLDRLERDLCIANTSADPAEAHDCAK